MKSSADYKSRLVSVEEAVKHIQNGDNVIWPYKSQRFSGYGQP